MSITSSKGFQMRGFTGLQNEMDSFNLNQGTASLYNNTIFLKSAQQSNESSSYLSSAEVPVNIQCLVL